MRPRRMRSQRRRQRRQSLLRVVLSLQCRSSSCHATQRPVWKLPQLVRILSLTHVNGLTNVCFYLATLPTKISSLSASQTLNRRSQTQIPTGPGLLEMNGIGLP